MLSGDKLRRARKDLNLSQKELGERIGVSGTLIGHYENGLRSPRSGNLELLAQALGVDPDWLMTQDGDDIQDNYMIRYNSLLQLAGLFTDPEKGRGFLKAYSQLCWNLAELQRVINENQVDDSDIALEADNLELENLRRIETFALNCCRSFSELKEKSPGGMATAKESLNHWQKGYWEFDFLFGEYLKMNGRGKRVCKQVIAELASKPEYKIETGEKYDLHMVGKRFKEVREEQGRTLEEVSRWSEVAVPRLQEIERGQGAAVDAKEISHICFALDLVISDVLPFEQEKAESIKKLYNSTKIVLDSGSNMPQEYRDSVCDTLLKQWEFAAQEEITRLRNLDDINRAEQFRVVDANRTAN